MSLATETVELVCTDSDNEPRSCVQPSRLKKDFMQVVDLQMIGNRNDPRDDRTDIVEDGT